MKKYFSIGETAKINNVSIQALRLYDKMGLLKPAYVDPKTKYRYYTIDQFMYLDLIRYSKYIGAPLKHLNNVKDINGLLSFIKKQKEEIEKELIRLKGTYRAIGHIEDKIEYALNLEEVNKVYIKEIEKRSIINIELSKMDKENDIEIKLRSMDKVIEDNDIMFEGESGYFVDLDLLLDKGEIYYNSVYSTLLVDGTRNKKINIMEIIKGKYLCINYYNDERKVALDKLRKYISNNNIHPKGIGLEVQLVNTINQLEKDKLLYELQISI